jgi:hypothetical protein
LTIYRGLIILLFLEFLSSGEDVSSLKTWATALALSFFEVFRPNRKDYWELVATKGRNWILQNCQENVGQMTTLLAIAKTFLERNKN